MRERERKKETKKRERGRKVIWAQGLVAARAAEATAGGRDGGSLTDSCASLRCNSELLGHKKDLATHDKARGAPRANVLIYWLWAEEETRETL